MKTVENDTKNSTTLSSYIKSLIRSNTPYTISWMQKSMQLLTIQPQGGAGSAP